MKYSGVKWIGDIPETWKVIKVKECFYISKEKAHQENPVVLSLARAGIKVRDISTNEGQLAASYEDYNPVIPGDLLLNPMDLYSGANCNVSEVSGVISSAYINLRKKKELNPKFFDYFFKTQYWSMAMFAHGKGVSFDNRWTMNTETVLNYYIPYPTLDEQNKIVYYLNRKCSEIDELISIESLQIKKFQEYKQAIISETVTKGLNSNVSYVDRGNIFLGNVPQHWKLNKVKFIATRLGKGNGITKEDIFVDGDTPCVRYGEIYTKYNISFKECMTRTNKSVLSKVEYFEYGDILFSGTGELVEEIGKNIVYLGNEKCLAGGDIIILSHNQNPLFMSYLLNSSACQMQKSYGKAKLKVVHISATEIGDINIVLPPIDEQNEIALFLENKCNEIDTLINLKQKKIEELYDYKKSIIYEYVTGKRVL